MRDWIAFYSGCTEEELEGIALLRVIECTNGCIQHAFRESNPIALPVEETREAMKFSMGLMKTYEFSLGEKTYSFSEGVKEGLSYVRNLYTEAFKKGNEEAMGEFFSSSEACVQALGMDRINQAAENVQAHAAEYIPPHTVSWGVSYLKRLLQPST